MAHKNPVRVIRSGLTGTVYALTNYRERENGLLQVTDDGKHDVSADVEAIVAARCAPLVDLLEKLANDRIRTELRADGYSVGDYFAAKAEAALCAYREGQGDDD